MVGRIAPIKHLELALEAIRILVSRGVQISLTIVGAVSKKETPYNDSLKKYITLNNLSNSVYFVGAVAPEKLPEIYSSHEVCLNLTESGSFDKTIVEASSCGAIPLVSNISLSSILPRVCITEAKPEIIADSLQKLLEAHVQIEIQNELKSFVDSQSLESLLNKITLELK